MMRGFGRWLLLSAPGAVAGVLAISASGLAPGTTAIASAAPKAGTAKAATVQSGPVSPNPASGTPALVHKSGVTDQIRQIVQCGGTMYAVGQFTEISGFDATTGTTQTFTRDDVFSFSATAPFAVTSWEPTVGGPVNLVDSIALNSTCSHAYIGGHFNKVDGTSAEDIAYIRTYNDTMVTSFPHSANAEVDTLLLTPNNHLLTGGEFTSINGSNNRYYVSLNPTTGKDDGYLALKISGTYVFPKVKTNNTQVYNQQLSPDGLHVLAEGVFTSVQGNPRQQIFMLNLSGTHGNVSTWDSTEFNSNCATKHPFYVKAAAWSPDMSTIYVADTGLEPDGWPQGKFPLTGLCDAVAAFPGARAGGLAHEWINYSGCDSFYSVAADSSAVYAAGHERWADNASGCNDAGSGAIPAQGMGGFTPGPTGGALMTNSGGTAGLYSRGRGLGADDMVITSAGLWIASDDEGDTDTCGNASDVAGICFLPYS
jgi:hypothetical protein